MGLRVYSGKELASAWGLALSSKGDSTHTTQSFDPFFDKLKKLIIWSPHKFMRLCAVAIDEAEQARFEAELPGRERRLTGRT